jgi:hypothetical protein
MNQWGGWWRTPLAVAVGVLLAIVIDRLTEYFTGTHASPVQEIKKGADTGPATLILQGIAVGYESSVWAILVIALTIVASIFIFGTILGVDAPVTHETVRVDKRRQWGQAKNIWHDAAIRTTVYRMTHPFRRNHG